MNFKLHIFAVLSVSVMMAGAALNDGLVFDLDLSAGDVNGNGRAEANEVRDRMSVSAAVPVKAVVMHTIRLALTLYTRPRIRMST